MTSRALILAVAALISLGVLGSPAVAQSTPAARFSVPFAFLAGGQELPAGEYLVKIDSAHFLVLQCRLETCGAVLPIAYETDRSSNSNFDHSVLRFEKRGHSYFLRELGYRARGQWSALARSTEELGAAKIYSNADHISIAAE
jgi:hypothetical protein